MLSLYWLCLTIQMCKGIFKVSFLEQMFNVRWWTWRSKIPLGQWCITKQSHVIVQLSPLWKKWGLGGLLSIDFSEMVKLETHSRLDRCNACGGGLMNKETMDHGILQRIIIALSAWCWINISYSHPRDWNIQVWRGQVEKEIKAKATGISPVTSMGFLENKWRTEVSICNYWQLLTNWIF